MTQEKIIAIWDILHQKNTGELGFSDLADAINRIDIGKSDKKEEINLEKGEIKIGADIYFIIPDKTTPGMYYLSTNKAKAISKASEGEKKIDDIKKSEDKIKKESKRVENNLIREEHGEIK